jgi:hypothetical protein
MTAEYSKRKLTWIKGADCDPVVALCAASFAAKALSTLRMLPMKTMVVLGISLLSVVLASRTEAATPPKYVGAGRRWEGIA